MRAFSLSPDGKLAITASKTSSQHDFDYLVGSWSIRNRTLKEPLSGSDEWKDFNATQEFRLVLLGQGNFDIFHTELDGKPFEGLTVRLFDPHTRLWTIYWADSNTMKLDGGKVGSFDGAEGEFFGREVVAEKEVIVKFHWDKRNPQAPIYSRAFSGLISHFIDHAIDPHLIGDEVPLTPEDERRFTWLVVKAIRIREFASHQYKSGHLDEKSRQSYMAPVPSMFATGRGKAVLAFYTGSPEFAQVLADWPRDAKDKAA